MSQNTVAGVHMNNYLEMSNQALRWNPVPMQSGPPPKLQSIGVLAELLAVLVTFLGGVDRAVNLPSLPDVSKARHSSRSMPDKHWTVSYTG